MVPPEERVGFGSRVASRPEPCPQSKETSPAAHAKQTSMVATCLRAAVSKARRTPMAGNDMDQAQPQIGPDVPGPDVMLGLWASWMDRMSASAQALGGPAAAWWEMTTNNPASNLITGGVD